MTVVARPDQDVQLVWRTALDPNVRVPTPSAHRLACSGHPDGGFPPEPWAAVVTVEDGVTAASVSPAFTGGLFWAWRNGNLLFADNVRHLVDHLAPDVDLDADFIRAFALLPRDVPGTCTPFRQIRRIEPGTTAIWAALPPSAARTHPSPRTVVWCGPDAWGEPRVAGPETLNHYLEAFDASVDAMLGPGPIVTQLSGGLDSSFVAASLLRHATAHDPVQALCHSPTPEAQLAPEARWDPDDYPVARTMEDAYPGLIVVHRVHPPAGADPLAAAAESSAGTGVPTFNPGNQVWINQLNGLAAELGANRLFTGAWGNASFSYDHDYATGYYVRRGHLGAAWRSLAPNRHGLPSRTALRNRVRAPLVGILRHALTPDAADWLRRHLLRREGSSTAYPSLIGLGYLGTDAAFPRVNRSEYLKWLAGAGPLGMAAMFSAQRVPAVDPFTTAQVRTLAAAITPLEWSRGLGSRGYARLLGESRVPDTIRLRTRRGGQSWDEWYQIRNRRQRYLDEAAEVANTPILGGWVDHSALIAILEAWPWGQVTGPGKMPVLAMNRILALASYVRASSEWSNSGR